MLTRDEFDAILANAGTLIIDGALATEIETRGHDLNHPLWSAKILKEDPESIRRVHLDYYLAGADISITASYQASTQGLRNYLGIDDDEAKKLIERSVLVARQARGDAYEQGIDAKRKLLVAGSVGPYGAFLADGSEYRGDYSRTKHEFQSFHRPRIHALLDGGVDLLAVETMPNFGEIEAVLEMLRKEYPGVICWLSCTIKDAHHVSDGTTIEALLNLANRYTDTIVAIGINCVPPGVVTEVLQHMQSKTKLPLLCYPNSGESWDATTKTWSGFGSKDRLFEEEIRSWQSGGARLIGGCCRTGPGYIETVAKTIQQR